MNKGSLVKAKWFVAGVLITLMLSGTVLMASPIMREIIFGVNVSLDGDILQFEDDMQPFIMDGRTFLPVRAIAEITGMGVDFDDATNTVILHSAGQMPGGGGGAQDAAGQQLIGAWEWTWGFNYGYVFNADGTGMRTYPDIGDATFIWRAEGDQLMIDLTSGHSFENSDFYIIYERWTYSIVDNMLTLVSRQIYGLEFSYLMLTSDNAARISEIGALDALARQLIGIWAWDGLSTWQYSFQPDGTGVRGTLGSQQTFNWWAQGNHILMETSYMLESWAFYIDNNVLTLTSRQVDGMEFSYIRTNE